MGAEWRQRLADADVCGPLQVRGVLFFGFVVPFSISAFGRLVSLNNHKPFVLAPLFVCSLTASTHLSSFITQQRLSTGKDHQGALSFVTSTLKPGRYKLRCVTGRPGNPGAIVGSVDILLLAAVAAEQPVITYHVDLQSHDHHPPMSIH